METHSSISCLGNPMDRGSWWGYSPWGCKKSDMTEHACMLLKLTSGYKGKITLVCRGQGVMVSEYLEWLYLQSSRFYESDALCLKLLRI